MAGLDDLNSTAKGLNTNISNLVTAIGSAFPRIVGTFTLAAATTTIVAQPAIAANSIVLLTPTNATAALTVRSAGLYHSANTPGASFSVSTQNGTAFGSETFEYVLVTTS